MNNNKTTSNNNQEEKIALESNDATFPTDEEIKQMLKKNSNQNNTNDKPKIPPTNPPKK